MFRRWISKGMFCEIPVDGKPEITQVIKALLVAGLFALPASASAEWTVRQGRKLSPFPPAVGTIATVAAKTPDRGVTSRLQIECFTHPELTGLTLSVVLSQETTPGLLGWRYRFDNGPTVQRGPYSRTSLTAIHLGDSSSEELRGLASAKRFRLTLVPTQSPEFTYDFDVTGAAEAINKVPCKRK